MLQILNRNQMHFTHRSHLHTLHPEDFYLDLVKLLGELMTFTENSRLPCPVEPYDHHDLTLSFNTVIPELRRTLNIVLMPGHKTCHCALWTEFIPPLLTIRRCCSLLPLCWLSGRECRITRLFSSLPSSRKLPPAIKFAMWSAYRFRVFRWFTDRSTASVAIP